MEETPPQGDVPSHCNRCARMTLHRRGTDGELHCLPCLNAPAPQVVHHVRQPEAANVVRSTISLAKFVAALIFLAMIGTCVYVCGSVADDKH